MDNAKQYDPRAVDYNHEVCDVRDISEIVRKKDGSKYSLAVIAEWIRAGLFATKITKSAKPLIPRWAVLEFTPPEQSGKTWVRRPDLAEKRKAKESAGE